jgi:hypothetical protein
VFGSVTDIHTLPSEVRMCIQCESVIICSKLVCNLLLFATPHSSSSVIKTPKPEGLGVCVNELSITCFSSTQRFPSATLERSLLRCHSRSLPC